MVVVIYILLAAVVVGFTIYSAKKGVMISFLEVIAFVAAVFLAGQCAAPVASGMYRACFQKTVERELYQVIPENPTGLTYSQKAQYVVDKLPTFVKNYTEKVGIDTSVITEKIAKSNYANNDQLYLTLEEQIVKPIAIAVLKNIMYFVLAVIFALILRAIAKGICKNMKKLDAVNATDKFLGGMFGVVKGLVVVFLLCCLLSYLQPRISNSTLNQAITDAKLITWADQFNPIAAVTAAGTLGQ